MCNDSEQLVLCCGFLNEKFYLAQRPPKMGARPSPTGVLGESKGGEAPFGTASRGGVERPEGKLIFIVRGARASGHLGLQRLLRKL
jgi:hypothetical protein